MSTLLALLITTSPGRLPAQNTDGQVVPLPASTFREAASAGKERTWTRSTHGPPPHNMPSENDRHSLTIDDLEQMAMDHNPTLSQAAHRIQALRGTHLQVGLYPNPIVGYVGEEIGDEGRAGQQGGFFGQEIITANKLSLSRSTVSHEITQVQLEWEMQRLRVANDVRTMAYNTVVAQQTIELLEELVQIGEHGQEVAEELLKAQEVSRVDVLQARIEANSTRLQLDNARTDYEAAWRKLAVVIGMPDMQPAPLAVRLENDIPVFTWYETFDWLMSSSPELRLARAGVERGKCALAREYAEKIPNVDLEGSVRYNNASEDTVTSIAVGVPLKIFNRNQGNIQRAQAALAAAREEVQRVRLALHERLAIAFREYRTAKQQVQRYVEEILPDAKDSLELVEQGYRQGEFGYLELLTAQRTYFRTNLAYLRALGTLWTSSVRIEGMLLSGALDHPGQ